MVFERVLWKERERERERERFAENAKVRNEEIR